MRSFESILLRVSVQTAGQHVNFELLTSCQIHFEVIMKTFVHSLQNLFHLHQFYSQKAHYIPYKHAFPHPFVTQKCLQEIHFLNLALFQVFRNQNLLLVSFLEVYSHANNQSL